MAAVRRLLLLGSLLSVALLAPGCDPDPPRMLFVGLDGADWDVIDALVEAGQLPTIGALVSVGTRADLDCVPAWPAFPCFCPPVWTSIFTGQPVGQHGMNAITSRADERGVKALWTLNGERGGVNTLVSMRNAWPFEDEVSWGISEPGLDDASRELHDAWGGSFDHPALDEPETLSKPSHLLQVLRLLPHLGERRPAWWAMARDRVAMEAMLPLALLTRLQSQMLGVPELVMVTLHSPDKSSHVTWGTIQAEPMGPLDLDELRRQADDWAGPIFIGEPLGFGNVASQYLEADRWLGELLDQVEYDYVVLASDHGFGRNPSPGLSGHHSPVVPEAHRGILSITGPGVRAGFETDATVLDVAPTLAYLLGLPVAEDLPGRLLLEAFTLARLARHPPHLTW